MLTTLLTPLDPGPLGSFRIIVGIAAAARSLIGLPLLLTLSEPGIAKAPLLEWMPQPSRPLAFALVAVWLVSALLFAHGRWGRVSGLTLLASLAFMLALDYQTYANHLYLMAWLVLLLMVADAGAGRVRRREGRPVVRWAVMLVLLQISIVYFYSAATKLNDSFLSGEALALVLGDGLLPFPEGLRIPAFLAPLAAVAVATELILALGLWSRRLRPVAVVAGIGLHLAIVLFLAPAHELIVFAALMWGSYPLFTPTLEPASTRQANGVPQ